MTFSLFQGELTLVVHNSLLFTHETLISTSSHESWLMRLEMREACVLLNRVCGVLYSGQLMFALFVPFSRM